MGFREVCHAILLYLNGFFHSSLSVETGLSQVPIVPQHTGYNDPTTNGHDGLKFTVPSGPENGKPFECHYPELGPDWSFCSENDNRTCWIKSSTGQTFDIKTDYETKWPVGKVREYFLEAGNMTIDGDGIPNFDGKVFNQQYPGPWIQACWGDIIKVTVRNNLKYNGTTVHWHGIRQLNSMEMDGVNGVTQCPIAPGKEFTYTFRATQYGSTWYHSHYSLQYADGLHGPMTIYGPSSAPYDHAKDPLIITDWNHRSAFKDWQKELVPYPGFPKMNSVLINGRGNFAGDFSKKKYVTTVKKGKKYLFRIINTSVDTTFIFMIDNHNLTVIETDFVPVNPFTVDHIVVGIGQRYHVQVDANPIDNGNLGNGNYWIRAIPAEGCMGFEDGNEPDERQGVFQYEGKSGTPTSQRSAISKACRDERYNEMKPIHYWDIPRVSIQEDGSTLGIGKMDSPNRPLDTDKFTWWAFGEDPLWLNFSDPIILDLNKTSWSKDYVVISDNRTADDWVYMFITAPATNTGGKLSQRQFFPVAHPMHLHGHDFALIAQGNDSTKIGEATFKFDNPPRRDVALLPAGGFLVIAFKADNPGSWLFHCHIPWHASSGLALQILERQGDLQKMMTEDRLIETKRVCAEWDEWYSKKSNWWDAHVFQDDSGI